MNHYNYEIITSFITKNQSVLLYPKFLTLNFLQENKSNLRTVKVSVLRQSNEDSNSHIYFKSNYFIFNALHMDSFQSLVPKDS